MLNRPTVCGARQFGQRSSLPDIDTGGAGTLQKKMVEEASFDRDLAAFRRGKGDPERRPRDSRKLDGIERRMRRGGDRLGDTERVEQRPATRIDAVPTYFFAREFFAFDHHGAKARVRADDATRRAGRTRADDGDVVDHPSMKASAT